MSKLTKSKLATLALAGLSAFASGSVLAGMTVDSNGGLEVFELDDANYWFKIGGRLHFTQAFLDGSDFDRTKFPSGSRISEARVTFKGGVGNSWLYKLDLDFNDRAGYRPYGPSDVNGEVGNPPNTVAFLGDAGKVSFGEAFLGYNGCKNFWLALGQISVPTGMEAWASRNDAPFMEISMASQAFDSPEYGLGIYAEWHNSMLTLAGAVYHPQAGTTQYGDVLSTAPTTVPGNGPLGSDPGSDPIGYGARLTFSPVHDDHAVYHFGVSAKYQNLHDHANNHNYYAMTEINSRQSALLFSNIPLNSSQDYMTWGAEAAGRWGPLMVAAEFMHSEVDREGNLPLAGDPRLPGGELKYKGYYVMASYVITGEAKDYDFVSGTFGRVRPHSHKGAWEVLIRHSYLDLVDNGALVPGSTPALGMTASATLPGGIDPNAIVGAAHTTTVGVNWWINDNVRLLANYARMNFPGSIDINGLGFKAIVNW